MPLIPDGTYTRKQLLDAIDLLRDCESEMSYKHSGVEIRGGELYAIIVKREPKEEAAPVPTAAPKHGTIGKDARLCHAIGCCSVATHGPLTIPLSCLEHRDMKWQEIAAREAA